MQMDPNNELANYMCVPHAQVQAESRACRNIKGQVWYNSFLSEH